MGNRSKAHCLSKSTILRLEREEKYLQEKYVQPG